MTEREIPFAQALYELAGEFREWIKEDCKEQDLENIETKRRMQHVDYANFCALQPLFKACRGRMKRDTRSVQSQTKEELPLVILSQSTVQPISVR